MEAKSFYFADRTGITEEKIELIPPVVIPKEAIDTEVERLASLPAPANGRRESRVVNPLTGVGDGLAPGIEVSISRVEPGRAEFANPPPFLSGEFLHPGRRADIVDGKNIHYSLYDVWTTPPWVVYDTTTTLTKFRFA